MGTLKSEIERAGVVGKVQCPYCGQPAPMVKGNVIYPHRRDLYPKNFWQCKPCDAYVGCHDANPKYGNDGTRPLGRMANPALRQAKKDAHNAFDPLWKDGHHPSRKAAYGWLAKQLGIPVEACHIGEFDVVTCLRVVTICDGARHENAEVHSD